MASLTQSSAELSVSLRENAAMYRNNERVSPFQQPEKGKRENSETGFGNEFDDVGDATGVTPFVVVPANNLGHIANSNGVNRAKD